RVEIEGEPIRFFFGIRDLELLGSDPRAFRVAAREADRRRGRRFARQCWQTASWAQSTRRELERLRVRATVRTLHRHDGSTAPEIRKHGFEQARRSAAVCDQFTRRNTTHQTLDESA